LAAHLFGHFSGDVKTKSGTRDVDAVGVVSTAELLEEGVNCLLAHANTSIGDIDVDTLFLLIITHKYIDTSLWGVLDGVIDEIVDDLVGLAHVSVYDSPALQITAEE